MTVPPIETTDWDTPDEVARRIRAAPRPQLIAFDCDGVLAPLVDHADDAVLLRGVAEMIDLLADQSGVTVAVVSGRSLAGLEQFGFHEGIDVVGSHGAERRGHATPELDEVEAARLAELVGIATTARDAAGDGAWIERKPASVVVHVIQAQSERGERALAEAAAATARIDGALAVPGRAVMELLARQTDKGTAIAMFKSELDPASVVYFGDDVTDEHAFAALGPDDLGVKVGRAPTVATVRLADPSAVRRVLEHLTGHLVSDTK